VWNRKSIANHRDAPVPLLYHPLSFARMDPFGGPVCSNIGGDCGWIIRSCSQSQCLCLTDPPSPVVCPNGMSMEAICTQREGQCVYVTPDCPSSGLCDCSSFPVPEIARQCPDGSFVAAVCVPTEYGCSYDFPCPSNECADDHSPCDHPLVGNCLGVCESNQCLINGYDSCLDKEAVVISVIVNAIIDSAELVSELSILSNVPTDYIFVLKGENRKYVVEYVSTSETSAKDAVDYLQQQVSTGEAEGTAMEGAVITILSEDYVPNLSSTLSFSFVLFLIIAVFCF